MASDKLNDRDEFTEQEGGTKYKRVRGGSNSMSTATKTNWSWNDAPFSTKLDVRRFYPGVSQEESLSRLHFLVDNQRRLGILTGPSGCGKSLALEVAAKQFRKQNRQVVLTSVIGVDVDEFLWKLAAGLGTNPCINASARELWRDIDDVIAANRYQCVATVILFDDLEEAETDVLAAITRLTQSDRTDDSKLTIILACNSNKTHLLGPRLPELCDLVVEIEPWSTEEVKSFVTTSLTAAACSPDLFTDGAIDFLARTTAGVPRRVQQLAQLALVAAAAQDLEQIDEDTLNAVHQELSTTAW